MRWLQNGWSLGRDLFRYAAGGKTAGGAAIQSVLLTAASMLMTLGSGTLLARGLGPHDRGVFAAGTTWPYILGAVSAVGSEAGLLICCSRSPSRAGAYASSAALLVSILVGVLGLSFAILAPRTFLREKPDIYEVALLCMPFALSTVLGVLSRQVLYADRQFISANVNAFSQHATYTVIISALFFSGSLNIRTAGMAFLVGGIAPLLLVAPRLLRTLQPPLRPTPAALSELVQFAYRAAPGDLLAIAAGFSDRILLIFLIVPAELGKYVVAYSISRVLSVLVPVSSVMIKKMSSLESGYAKRVHDLTLKISLLMFLPALFALEISAHAVVNVLFGWRYLGAVPALRVLALEGALFCCANIGGQLYTSVNRPGLNSAVQATSASVTVVAVSILALRWGALGGAVGLLIGTATRVALLWGGMAVALRLGMPDPLPRLRDIRAVRSMLASAGRS
ncbi:MAG TPA: hypothetical protein VJS38_20930 [Phenylobacterium sp.]|uniref:hypothetical protein n=1 Tax=Phenylobacterium sp. TaxID=1871053 RepID=UPI002B482FD5|nr:hypothetical protein [Phenylobacterium sp.]HKR90643.1 hypothetical protein [Phenylobacterium sp.]